MILSIITAIDFPSWLREDVFTIGSFSLKWYGLGYVVGLFGAYLYAVSLTKRRDVWLQSGPTRIPVVVPTKEMLSDLMFYCLIGIILGGRLGYIILYSPSTFVENPLDVLKVWKGGMSFHGGFSGVVLAGLYASWRHKIEKFRIGDMAAVGAPIGLGLVRLTNFMNQELYGNFTNVPWGVRFNAVNEYTRERIYDSAGEAVFQMPRHPSQLYEAFLEGLVLFLILRLLTVKFKALTKPGIVFGSLTFFYGVFRFAVEFVREPDAEKFGILTRGMAYSLPMIIIGAIIIVWAYGRAPVSPKRIKEDDNDNLA
ncbi:MAG: prolipoprotein diacylglyceryl transferase [Litorimonas sp.]